MRDADFALGHVGCGFSLGSGIIFYHSVGGEEQSGDAAHGVEGGSAAQGQIFEAYAAVDDVVFTLIAMMKVLGGNKCTCLSFKLCPNLIELSHRERLLYFGRSALIDAFALPCLQFADQSLQWRMGRHRCLCDQVLDRREYAGCARGDTLCRRGQCRCGEEVGEENFLHE